MMGNCTNLAGSEYPGNLPRYRFVTAKVRSSFEDEADVVKEVVSGIRLLVKPHWEAENAVRFGCADDQPAA